MDSFFAVSNLQYELLPAKAAINASLLCKTVQGLRPALQLSRPGSKFAGSDA